MKVPENVRQAGIALRRKMLEECRESVALQQACEDYPVDDDDSVEAIIAREERMERKMRQAKPAKDVARTAPAPVQTPPQPEPKPVVIKAACPVTYGLPPDDRPFGDTPPRDVPRADLTAWALNIIRTEGPQSTNGLLTKAFGDMHKDDRMAMRQRLPKWLMAECQYMDPPLTMKRWRSTQGGEKRDNLFGFWASEQLDKEARSRRSPVDLSEVISRLDTLCQELATVRSVQQEILHRQASIRDGLAAALEKLTWCGEV